MNNYFMAWQATSKEGVNKQMEKFSDFNFYFDELIGAKTHNFNWNNKRASL